jgi:hypothetical protein
MFAAEAQQLWQEGVFSLSAEESHISYFLTEHEGTGGISFTGAALFISV